MTTTTIQQISPEQISAIEHLIRSYIRRTPVIETDAADFGLDPLPLSFKLEDKEAIKKFAVFNIVDSIV